MKEIDPITGQSIDYQENKDNSPPRYSAPDIRYKLALKYHANQECSRCGGSGYIGQFKHISAGRCFECLPDSIWESRFGEQIATGVDDYTKK